MRLKMELKNKSSLVKLKTLALFNWLRMQGMCDKKIGDLSIENVIEIVEFLGEESNAVE